MRDVEVGQLVVAVGDAEVVLVVRDEGKALTGSRIRLDVLKVHLDEEGVGHRVLVVVVTRSLTTDAAIGRSDLR
ncbi:hypothetical protein D3C87_1845300 [compost metagenome]